MPMADEAGLEADYTDRPPGAAQKLSVMLHWLSAGRQFGLGEPVLLHAVDEGSTGDAEQARGLRPVARGDSPGTVPVSRPDGPRA